MKLRKIMAGILAGAMAVSTMALAASSEVIRNFDMTASKYFGSVTITGTLHAGKWEIGKNGMLAIKDFDDYESAVINAIAAATWADPADITAEITSLQLKDTSFLSAWDFDRWGSNTNHKATAEQVARLAAALDGEDGTETGNYVLKADGTTTITAAEYAAILTNPANQAAWVRPSTADTTNYDADEVETVNGDDATTGGGANDAPNAITTTGHYVLASETGKTITAVVTTAHYADELSTVKQSDYEKEIIGASAGAIAGGFNESLYTQYKVYNTAWGLGNVAIGQLGDVKLTIKANVTGVGEYDRRPANEVDGALWEGVSFPIWVYSGDGSYGDSTVSNVNEAAEATLTKVDLTGLQSTYYDYVNANRAFTLAEMGKFKKAAELGMRVKVSGNLIKESYLGNDYSGSVRDDRYDWRGSGEEWRWNYDIDRWEFSTYVLAIGKNLGADKYFDATNVNSKDGKVEFTIPASEFFNNNVDWNVRGIGIFDVQNGRGAVKNLQIEIIDGSGNTFEKGDLNGDGEITAKDALAALKIANSGKATSEEIAKADMNNDGKVTAADALAILKLANAS